MPLWPRMPAAFVLWMMFAFSFLQSVTVTVAWSKGTLTASVWE